MQRRVAAAAVEAAAEGGRRQGEGEQQQHWEGAQLGSQPPLRAAVGWDGQEVRPHLSVQRSH